MYILVDFTLKNNKNTATVTILAMSAIAAKLTELSTPFKRDLHAYVST